MGAKIKKALGWWVGNDFAHRWLLGMAVFLFGILIAKHVEYAFRGPTIKEIVWSDTFSTLPVWIGYYFIATSIDLILFRVMGHVTVCRYILWPPAKFALTRALGPERMVKFMERMKSEDTKAKETTG